MAFLDLKNITFEIIFKILNEQVNSRLSRDEETIGELENKFKEIIQSIAQRAKEANIWETWSNMKDGISRLTYLVRDWGWNNKE